MPRCEQYGAPVYNSRYDCPPPKDPGPWIVLEPMPQAAPAIANMIGYAIMACRSKWPSSR